MHTEQYLVSCVMIQTLYVLLDKFKEETTTCSWKGWCVWCAASCSHHNNCNHQSGDSNQVNLIWEQFLDPAVATLQEKKKNKVDKAFKDTQTTLMTSYNYSTF